MGAIYGCAGSERLSSAACADYAEAAAVILTSDNQAGKVYELAGDTSYTLRELADEISRQCGKKIDYINLPESEYKKALLGVGLSEFLEKLLANSDTVVSSGQLFDDDKQLSKLIGRPTTTLETIVKAAL